jgi:uncharacterized membrane protein HdeD (DUF308 family)
MIIDLREHLRVHKTSYYIQSILLIVLGAFALVAPYLMAVSLSIVIGISLTISGLIKAFHAFSTKMDWWYLLFSILIAIIGVLMIIRPISGAAALALMVGVYFLLESIFEISLALEFWKVSRSLFLILSGILSFILALAIFLGVPHLSITVLGVVVGINFILLGISMFMLVKKVQ